MKTLIVAVALYACLTKLASCSPYQSSCDHLGSPKISYKEAMSEEDVLKIGCNIQCRLTETGIYKDGIIHSSIVDPDFKEHGIIKECTDKFHAVNEELDCSHFYELWKCMEKLREPWSHLENIKEIEAKCVENNECFGKCIYEEVGIWKDGVFTSENTAEDLAPEYRKYIVRSLSLCHENMNEHYEEDERYSCKYFQDFDSCFRKQLSIF